MGKTLYSKRSPRLRSKDLNSKINFLSTASYSERVEQIYIQIQEEDHTLIVNKKRLSSQEEKLENKRKINGRESQWE